MSLSARSQSRRTLVDGGMVLSRRAFMAILGATVGTAGLGWPSARAQDTIQDGVWQEYRRDDLGFRIELPGEPKVEVTEGEADEPIVRTTDVELDDGEKLFSITCDEYKRAVSAQRVFAAFRDGMGVAGLAATGENELSVNGFPAREFVRESDDLNFIYRFVVAGNLMIVASVNGKRAMHGDPAVRRFIDSFKVLRTAP